MFTRPKTWIVLAALILAANVLSITTLVPEWGRWYSYSEAFRRQTDALLRGSLEIDESPAALDWDHVWANGVQQPWGLGVPAWRLPFELLARAFGFDAFPDRLALGFAYAFVGCLVMRVFLSDRFFEQPLVALRDEPQSLLAVPLLLLFPPLLTMCRGPFLVYDEVVAYGYLASVALLAGLVAFLQRPTLPRLIALALAAGLAPWIRPTLLGYGLGTLLVALMHVGRLKRPVHASLAAVAVFGAGLGLLFATNVHRFGSGFEFGHALTQNNIHPLRYMTRFGAPFENEPLLSAASELFSIMFLLGERFNPHDRFAEGIFPGQSPTFRWREFYFETFDLSYLALTCLGWLGTLWWRRRRWKVSDVNNGIQTENATFSLSGPRWAGYTAHCIAVWSLLGFAMLFAFYLRRPYISSRYVVDFTPAFAAAILLGFGQARRALPAGWLGSGALYVAFVLWWTGQMFASSVDPQATRRAPLTYAEMKAKIERRSPAEVPLPASHSIGTRLDQFGIPFNGSGWEAATGFTTCLVAVFVQDPQLLELELAPAGGDPLAPADYNSVRVKIGLEFLELERSEETDTGRRLIFRGPRRTNYQRGVQAAFLALTRPQELSDRNSKFRLLKLRWGEIPP
jgi:hypothetical protein